MRFEESKMKEREHIDLTEELIEQINADDIIAITLCGGGGMGDLGAIELVDKDLKVFYTHRKKIDDGKLEKLIPFIKTIEVEWDNFKGLTLGWEGLYTGCGNCLLLRSEFKEPLLKCMEDNYYDENSELPYMTELYLYWYDALKAVLKNEEFININEFN